MKEMIIKIPDDSTDLVTGLVEKSGGSVEAEKEKKASVSKKKKSKKKEARAHISFRKMEGL